MTTEITKNLMCILMRDGVEIWIEEEKLETLKEMIETRKFVSIGKEMINTVDISGIYEAKTMEEKTRRKNGQWKCKFGYWHQNKNEECAHGRIY